MAAGAFDSSRHPSMEVVLDRVYAMSATFPGRPVLVDQESFGHHAVFYEGSAGYLAALVPFVVGGVTAGEPVAVAVPSENMHVVRDHIATMESGIVDRVHWVDMAEAGRNPGRIISDVLLAFADLHDGQRVHIVGEPIWPGRSTVEYAACVQHEALINKAFAGRTVTIMCPYDARHLHPAVLADAEATHPILGDGELRRHSTAYAPESVLNAYNTPMPVPEEAHTFRVRLADIAMARDKAAELAVRAGLARERIDEIKLTVNELATNSVEHGGGMGTMRTWVTDTALVYEMSDAGHITDPLAGRRPAGPRQRRKRGLLIVNRLADLVRTYTSEHGTVVRAYFDR